MLPVQVLGELFNMLLRKSRWPAERARAAVLGWGMACRTIETSAASLDAATALSAEHQLGLWDAVILAVAADAGCDTLSSEDLNHGFTWRGTTVRNPLRGP